ncbi:GMC oxidoreductase [Favolaschia claudopus]|uniref:GMC oxidoreductase n=1 Tax=Favolaschia claudopus TaxID=2862362 RepID=A0AAV9ZDB3_9AGAR
MNASNKTHNSLQARLQNRMDSASFDYIVVGGGTAGLVVATRLVEDPDIRVCVLEAGEDVSKELSLMTPGIAEKSFKFKFPLYLNGLFAAGMAFGNLGQPRLDWGALTTPQPHANGRSIYSPRGKGLGGSSTINFMALGRGHEAEYNVFESLGSPGWNFKDFLKYFRKSETFAPTEEEISRLQIDFNEATHGKSGPLHRTAPRWITDLQKPFIEAMQTLGVKYNRDASSGDNTGMWISSHSIDTNGARCSSATAYYEPNKSTPNLVVITGAQATRIVFNDELDAKRKFVASGVEYHKDGQLQRVSAKKEVILSAGAFRTPQLLELSGIGQKSILEAQKIPVKVDLPGVGINLRKLSLLCDLAVTDSIQRYRNSAWVKIHLTVQQDHFYVPFVTEVDSKKYPSYEALADPARFAEELKHYQKSKGGKLSTFFSALFSFLPKNYFMSPNYMIPQDMRTNLNPEIEAIQKQWIAANEIPFLEIALFPGYIPAVVQQPQPGKSYCTIFIALSHAFSSGSVHVASPDPLTAPCVDYGVLDNLVDVDILVNAIQFARKLVATESLSGIMQEVCPGPAMTDKAELENFVRGNISTVFHPIGTAAMLPKSKGGVVDASLKVYGTANLRVVDASVMPIHISAHIQATVYAIAEKGADIIQHERK